MSGSTAINPPEPDQPARGDGDTRIRRSADEDRVADHGVVAAPVAHDTILARQKERFGGMKAGSAFFGWLTATGTSVILLALVAAIAGAVGASANLTQQTATDNAQQIGLVGGIVVVVVIGVAYFCGGYVAGRMARFNGSRQGVGVWLWAVVITVVVAVLGLIAGNQFDVLAQVGTLPRLPVSADNLTLVGVVYVLVVAAAALVGAVLGGLSGMRYHRRIDRADLTVDP